MMPNALENEPETGRAADAADALTAVAGHGSEDAFSPACAGLSNDYLNHYSEVLMLIEMAADDPAFGAELAEWRPVSYRDYFDSSDLRRASAALAAYDALPEDRRLAFEKLVAAMDAIATMAVFALQPPSDPSSAPVIVAGTAPPLRKLIAKAGAFLNSGGEDLALEGGEAQGAIDEIIGYAALRAAG